jgi:transposase
MQNGHLIEVGALKNSALLRNLISGRGFSSVFHLAPRQGGTGGRVKLPGIRKRGDGYLRRLLIHGARALITHAKARDPWVEALLARRLSFEDA